MPDGRTHAIVNSVNLVVMGGVAAGGLALSRVARTDTGQSVMVAASVGLVIGGFAGLMITPDIDHQWTTYEELRIKRWFGKWALRLWKFYWLPFLLPGHRSHLTHSWPLGTVLRQIWFFVWPTLALALVLYLTDRSFLETIQTWLREWPAETFAMVLMIFVGWSWQDQAHLWMDSHFKISEE